MCDPFHSAEATDAEKSHTKTRATALAAHLFLLLALCSSAEIFPANPLAWLHGLALFMCATTSVASLSEYIEHRSTKLASGLRFAYALLTIACHRSGFDVSERLSDYLIEWSRVWSEATILCLLLIVAGVPAYAISLEEAFA